MAITTAINMIGLASQGILLATKGWEVAQKLYSYDYGVWGWKTM